MYTTYICVCCVCNCHNESLRKHYAPDVQLHLRPKYLSKIRLLIYTHERMHVTPACMCINVHDNQSVL